jgi:4-carboxymuconolactone decarboxylase
VKSTLALVAGVLVLTASTAAAQQPNVAGRRYSPDQVRAVAPALERYTQERLYGDIWNRPGLNRRDRSLVTVAALIASGKTEQVPFHLNRAMDNGLTEAQAAEVITHVAFYAGWPNAMSALPVAKEVFARRGGGGARK